MFGFLESLAFVSLAREGHWKVFERKTQERTKTTLLFSFSFVAKWKVFHWNFLPIKAEKKRVEATLIKLFLCAFKFSIMSFFFVTKFCWLLHSLSGLQSLWTTAICSSNLQHKQQHLNPPTTSQSSDQLLQLESPLSDKGKNHDPLTFLSWALTSFHSLPSGHALLNVLIKNPINLKVHKSEPSEKKSFPGPSANPPTLSYIHSALCFVHPSISSFPPSTRQWKWKVRKKFQNLNAFYPSSFVLFKRYKLDFNDIFRAEKQLEGVKNKVN